MTSVHCFPPLSVCVCVWCAHECVEQQVMPGHVAPVFPVNEVQTYAVYSYCPFAFLGVDTFTILFLL